MEKKIYIKRYIPYIYIYINVVFHLKYLQRIILIMSCVHKSRCSTALTHGRLRFKMAYNYFNSTIGIFFKHLEGLRGPFEMSFQYVSRVRHSLESMGYNIFYN